MNNSATLTTVRDVMSSEVTTVGPNEDLATADDVMRLGRFRHMPVVDEDGDLVGIVTQRDLFHNAVLKALGYGAHAATKARQMLRVKDAMTTQVITTTGATSLRDAARLMRDRQIGCLVVVDEGGVAGIITEGDFVALFADR